MIAQTLATPNLSVKGGFGAARKHWKKPIVGGCNQVELRDPGKLEKTRLVKSVDSRSLEGSSIWGRLGLEGLLLFVYNLFSSGSIYHLEGGGEVFHRVFRFPLQ